MTYTELRNVDSIDLICGTQFEMLMVILQSPYWGDSNRPKAVVHELTLRAVLT